MAPLHHMEVVPCSGELPNPAGDLSLPSAAIAKANLAL